MHRFTLPFFTLLTVYHMCSGSLSVPELVNSLKDDEFAFGLMRLGFGSGRFRRVKWVSLTWSGSSVGAVKRAKAMQVRHQAITLAMQVRACVRAVE